MGILKKIFAPRAATVQSLPRGRVTVDRQGSIILSTISSGYPEKLLVEAGHAVVKLFQEAREAQLPLNEINLHYGSLRIAARELRGGAVLFFQPQSLSPASSNPLPK